MLIDEIRTAQLASRKARTELVTAVLTTLLGECLAIGKKENREPTDAEVVGVVKKFLDNNVEFMKVAPAEKVGPLTLEKDTISVFIPKQMDKSELKRVITLVAPEGFTLKDKGTVMKELKAKFAGQYDGKLAMDTFTQMCQGELSV